MEDAAHEEDFGGVVGVIFCEFHGEFKSRAFPDGIIGAKDVGLPFHDVVGVGGCGAAVGGILLESLEITHETATGIGSHWVVGVDVWKLW